MSIRLLTFPLFVLAISSCTQRGQLFKKNLPETTVAPISQASVLAYLEPSPSVTEAARSSSKIKKLGTNINTPYSDYAPFRYGERLYFTTTKLDANGNPSVDNVLSSLLTGTPISWTENAEKPGEHTAHTALTADNRRIYYTICKEEKSGKQECEILTRERAFEGYWLPSKRLKGINMDGFNSTHPSIGFDFTLRKEVLYFASDRPGGKGGFDIWCSPIEANGVHGTPFPLPTNTEKDDVTPFFYQQGQVLFFSSNRQEENSFDIYRVEKKNKTWGEVEALNSLFNSPYNELYFTCHQRSGKSYFCSDRPGCISADSTKPCIGYDIFEGPLPIELQIEVLLANGDAILEDATISLIDMETGIALEPEQDSKRHFFLQPGKKYRAKVEASGYSTESLDIEPSAANVLSVFKKQVRLRQNAKLIIHAYNALDSLPLGGTGFVITSGNGSRQLAHQNGENDNSYGFMITFGDDSKLEVSKPGFNPTIVNFDAMTAVGPSAVMDMNVYLKPFSALPISLYFDNDQPRWMESSIETETRMGYEQLLLQYMERKSFFVERYSEGLAQDLYEANRQQVLAFFDEEVQAGLQELNELCGEIEPYLKKGYQLEILAEGQASPLAAADYNQRLTARRVSSIRNYMKTWRKGALKPYLYSGKLLITSSFLEASQPVSVESTNQAIDRKVVEFSPAASKMRRIIIRDVRLKGNKV